MAANDQSEQDRTEEATPFKLEEARKRGQVFKSPEINSLAILGGALLVAAALGRWMIHGTLTLGRDLFSQAGRVEISTGSFFHLASWVTNRGLFIVSPLLVVAAIAAILSNLFQTGPVFSFFPLKPDFSKLNPAQGFKRAFSLRALYEGLKSFLKFALLAGVIYGVVRHFLPEILSLSQRSVGTYPAELLHIAVFALLAMLLTFSLLAFADNAYSRWEYRKKMRMSRRELKEETRRREGDPQIKSRRRELLRSLQKNAKSIPRVKDADIVITNPTHYAIALQYDRPTMHAPKVISKGAGDLAVRIKKVAFRYGIVMIEAPDLARKLYREVDIDGFIPSDAYLDVAALLRPVLEARGRKGPSA